MPSVPYIYIYQHVFATKLHDSMNWAVHYLSCKCWFPVVACCFLFRQPLVRLASLIYRFIFSSSYSYNNYNHLSVRMSSVYTPLISFLGICICIYNTLWHFATCTVYNYLQKYVHLFCIIFDYFHLLYPSIIQCIWRWYLSQRMLYARPHHTSFTHCALIIEHASLLIAMHVTVQLTLWSAAIHTAMTHACTLFVSILGSTYSTNVYQAPLVTPL